MDWPGAYYWRELADHYPDAKILLTLRSPESWYDSMSKTILPVLRASTDPESVGLALVARGVFDGELDDREVLIRAYERNTREVQAAFGPDPLLTYELGMCAFLGVPVPDAAYPHSNSSEAFNAAVQERRSGH